MATFVPLVASTSCPKNGAGEQITESTASFEGTTFFTSSTKLFASERVLFIFQLPAIIGLRIVYLPFK